MCIEFLIWVIKSILKYTLFSIVIIVAISTVVGIGAVPNFIVLEANMSF